MATSLTKIFKSLLPENITSDKFMSEVIEIYCDFIEENCSVSLDIGEVYNEKNSKFKEEYIKIYLDDLYRTFKAAETSPIIINKINEINAAYGYEYLSLSFIGNITKLITNEHLTTSKAFKHNKGTRVGIEYIYNLVERIDTSQDSYGDFKLIEGEPFHMQIEGSVYSEIYDEVVKPLAHPLGWSYIYNQIIKTVLNDDFNKEYSYQINAIEVRCLDGYFHVFTEDSDYTIIKEDFIGNRGFTEEEYNNFVTVSTSKIPDEVSMYDENGISFKKIVFTDGTYLTQSIGPIDVNYWDSNDVLINSYNNTCSLYVDYIESIVILTLDDIVQELEILIGTIKEENSGNAGVSTYKKTQNELGFIIGDTRTLQELNPNLNLFLDEYVDYDDEFNVGLGASTVEFQSNTSDNYDMTSRRNARDADITELRFVQNSNSYEFVYPDVLVNPQIYVNEYPLDNDMFSIAIDNKTITLIVSTIPLWYGLREEGAMIKVVNDEFDISLYRASFYFHSNDGWYFYTTDDKYIVSL